MALPSKSLVMSAESTFSFSVYVPVPPSAPMYHEIWPSLVISMLLPNSKAAGIASIAVALSFSSSTRCHGPTRSSAVTASGLFCSCTDGAMEMEVSVVSLVGVSTGRLSSSTAVFDGSSVAAGSVIAGAFSTSTWMLPFAFCPTTTIA